MTESRLRIGVAGLGGAASKVLPWLSGPNGNGQDGLVLAAGADIRDEARRAFEATYARPAYASVAELCRSSEVHAVYIATPSSLHCEHTLEAVRAGKHVLVEKPLATRLEDCDRMIAAASGAGVLLVQGHSKLLDSPVQAMLAVLESGRLGAVFQVDAWNANDWMRRPRLATELDTAAGGGVVLRQAPQLVDLVRALAGRPVRTVRAVTGRHAAGLDTEGSFSALISFEGDVAATVSFNGYGHLDIGALFHSRNRPDIVRARRSGPVDATEKYHDLQFRRGGSMEPSAVLGTSGLTLVSCERGVMVQSPLGLYLFADGNREEIRVTDTAGRAAGLVELRDALREGRRGFPDGKWARTTLETCLAILESSRKQEEIPILGESIAAATQISI